MFGENNNLKNLTDNTNLHTAASLPSARENGVQRVSYTKTNKLITALYMVTDIMDINEPIRAKLRSLGVEILSDMHSSVSAAKGAVASKADEAMSFLGVAGAMNMISEMNKNILVREFTLLKDSLVVFRESSIVSLESFFESEEVLPSLQHPLPASPLAKGEGNKIPQRHTPVNFGMQKGHSLMKAISDKMTPTNKGHKKPTIYQPSQNFDMLKKERRFEIVRIIKDMKSATIKDIKDNARGALISCGEKTLQRELVSMVHDGVLKKTGEKRWSKYSII